MAERPNILFLMSDEHRADVAGYEGNAVIRTPTLDELARTGVVFSSAYAPSPICIPGRQCMMAGQLPRTCRCEHFGQDLAPGAMTFARRFAQYAYATVCCGKLHHVGTDQMQGWTDRIAGDCHVDARYLEGREPAEFARYTRETREVKWSDAKEIQRAGVAHGPYQKRDDLALAGALEAIERHFLDPYYDREQPQQPLLLKLSLLQPHYPFFTDERRFKYYLSRVQPFLGQTPSDHPFLGQRQVRPGIDASARDIRRATAAYYGMIEAVDDAFGRVLEALDDAGQDLDDWIIVYTSDHGDMLGEHGIWEKQKFYEASARVPLIIRWPRRLPSGAAVTQNVSQCDLFATLCDLAGLPTPPGLDSRSLVPLMEGRAAGWSDEAVSQFGARNLMIKQGALKYQYYGPDMPEVLFDLARDPGELTNVVDAPEYAGAVADFRRRLAELGHGPDADSNYVNAGYGQ